MTAAQSGRGLPCEQLERIQRELKRREQAWGGKSPVLVCTEVVAMPSGG